MLKVNSVEIHIVDLLRFLIETIETVTKTNSIEKFEHNNDPFLEILFGSQYKYGVVDASSLDLS